jgi:hypothetical protein
MIITVSKEMTPATVKPAIAPALILFFPVGVDLFAVPFDFEGLGLGGGRVICTLRYAEEL